MIDGGMSVPWLKTLVFLRLIVRPMSEHADENWLSSVYRSWAEWAMSAASSAKRRSRAVKLFTFCFALRHARLKRLPSVLVWSLIPRDEDTKARFNIIEKKIRKELEQVCSFALSHFWFQMNQYATIILDSRPCVSVKRLHNFEESWRASNLQQYCKQFFSN